MRFDLCGRRICSEGAASISCGRHGYFFYAECFGHANRDRDSAGFERSSGIQAFVFDPNIGKLTAGENWSKAFAQRNGVDFRKNFTISPKICFPACESTKSEFRFDLQIVSRK
jgi:hypothetical protein